MPFSIENIHPLLVHFPIALLSIGLFFDILYRITYNEEFNHTAFWSLATGIIACLLANISGLFAFLSEGSFTDIIKFKHGLLAWFLTLFFIIIFWFRIKFELELKFSNFKKNAFFLLELIMIIVLFYMAHLGAQGEREWLI